MRICRMPAIRNFLRLGIKCQLGALVAISMNVFEDSIHRYDDRWRYICSADETLFLTDSPAGSAAMDHAILHFVSDRHQARVEDNYMPLHSLCCLSILREDFLDTPGKLQIQNTQISRE